VRSFLGILFFIAAEVYAACPATPPNDQFFITQPTGCPCPNGLVPMKLSPVPGNGYAIQPCDSVTWDFDDGTSETVTGSDSITHWYPNPDNYTPRVTITNALGSATVKLNGTFVIATHPAFLGFAFPGSPAICGGNCIEAYENSGSVTITATRKGDLTRIVTVDFVLDAYGTPGAPSMRVPLTFGPSETAKDLTIPLTDDDIYFGKRYNYFYFTSPRGGAQVAGGLLEVLEDDPRPLLTMASHVFVREGDSGLTKFEIPFRISAPMAVNFVGAVSVMEGTATRSDFQRISVRTVLPGERSGNIVGWIRGDRRPEADETFTLKVTATSQYAPTLPDTPTLVTILNDDAELTPASATVMAGTSITLTLDVGSPYATPVTAWFTSSAEAVVAAPAPVTIPAGATSVQVTIPTPSAGTASIGAIVPDRTVQPAVVTVRPGRRHATGMVE